MLSPLIINHIVPRHNRSIIIPKEKKCFYERFHSEWVDAGLMEITFSVVSDELGCFSVTEGSNFRAAKRGADLGLWWNPDTKLPDINYTLDDLSKYIDNNNTESLLNRDMLCKNMTEWLQLFPEHSQQIEYIKSCIILSLIDHP
jgi:hypothetical protein